MNSGLRPRLRASILVALIATYALADLGPKPPPSYFRWKGGKAPADVEFITVWLLQCQTDECTDARASNMPQSWFGCGTAGCYASSGFGFSGYAQLSAKVAGKRLRSKPFKMSSGSFFEIDIQPGQVAISVAPRPFSDEERKRIGRVPSEYGR